jgi:peptidoglycan/xylan/chitin deacetylase (PgdA/CDA1 family)
VRAGLLSALVLALLSPIPAAAAPPQRSVAVTIDDLPGPTAGLASNEPAALRANTRKLLDALKAHKVPAVGFVNEGKLFLEGEGPEGVKARTEVLSLWLEDGLELGNHTYSHVSLNRTELPAFQADLEKGETVTRGLLAARGRKLRYFRHPFLQVGLELPKRRAFEAYLKERGYRAAPVTIDNDEYMFAAVYADALKKKDSAQAGKIAAEYLRYMAGVVEFFEAVSRRVTGREMAQILLIHANALNADHMGPLLEIFEKRGYRFVTLEEALRDPAYALPDDYVGAWGISWLHHWEVTAGLKRSPSPDAAEWITKSYEALSR